MNLQQSSDIGYGSFIFLENDMIGRFILRYNFWEEHLVKIYSALLNPDSVIIDAGANIGFHTVQFARLGKKVYAFEPQPVVFNLLSTNILFNDLSQKVKQYRLGLSDKKISLNMQSTENFTESNGVINYGGLGVTTENLDTDKVDLIKWDDEFADAEKIDFMKMDVQGSEIYALKGMERMLKASKPWMMLENYNHEGDSPVIDYLLDLGYEVYRPMSDIPPEDCMCFHKDSEEHQKMVVAIKTLPLEFKKYSR